MERTRHVEQKWWQSNNNQQSNNRYIYGEVDSSQWPKRQSSRNTEKDTLLSQLRSLDRNLQASEVVNIVHSLSSRRMLTHPRDYTAAITALGKCGQWVASLQLLNAMTDGGLEANVISYGAAISACERSGGRWKEALGLLEDMKCREIQPNVVTYTAAIGACEKGGGIWQVALNLLEEMRGQHLEPNVITYTSAVSACAKGQQLHLALGLLKQMEKETIRPDEKVYNAAINACEKAGGLWERALMLMAEMRSKRLRPNVVTHTAVISCLKNGGLWERALSMLSDMQNQNVHPNVITYTAAISACEKAKQPKVAMALLQELRGKHIRPTEVTYNTVIGTCRHSGDWERAFSLMEHMVQDRLSVDVVTCNAVLSVCDKCKQLPRAFQLLREMKAASIQPSMVSYQALLGACSNEDGSGHEWYLERPDEVIKVLDGMIKSRLPINPTTYNVAIDLCLKMNELERAVDLLEQLQAGGFVPDASFTEVIDACRLRGGAVWTQASNVLARVRDLDGARSQGIPSISSPMPSRTAATSSGFHPASQSHSSHLLRNRMKDSSSGDDQVELILEARKAARTEIQFDLPSASGYVVESGTVSATEETLVKASNSQWLWLGVSLTAWARTLDIRFLSMKVIWFIVLWVCILIVWI